MKAVLISIQPKWIEKIVGGKKTVEVRKTRPKLETPFKCYIYETIEKVKEIVEEYDSNFKLLRRKRTTKQWGGKVIGEFVCDKMLESFLNNNDGWFIEKGCLTQEEIDKYQGDNAILYGWHISDLKIYDKPKELSEFYARCNIPESKCKFCDNCYDREDYYGRHYAVKKIKRPPQSWQFIEIGE